MLKEPPSLDWKKRARDFEEVPARFLGAKSWGGVIAAQVREDLDIPGLEAEALVVAYKHLLRPSACRAKRLLALVDDVPLCFAVTRGRAASSYPHLPS